MKISKSSEPAGRASETLPQVWDGQHFLAYLSGEEIVIQHMACCPRISKIDSEKMGTGDILLSLAMALNSFEWLFALRLAFLPTQRLILEGLGMDGATTSECFNLHVCLLLFGNSLSPGPMLVSTSRGCIHI